MLDFLQPLLLCSAPGLKDNLQPACVAATGALATAFLSVLGVITAAVITGGVNIYLKVLERRNKVYELYLPDKRKAIDDILDTLNTIIPETIRLANLVENHFTDPSNWPKQEMEAYATGDPPKLAELKILWKKTQKDAFKLMATGGVKRQTMAELMSVVEQALGVFETAEQIIWIITDKRPQSGVNALEAADKALNYFFRRNPKARKEYSRGVMHLKRIAKDYQRDEQEDINRYKLLWHRLYLLTYSLKDISEGLQKRLYAEKLK